jgi:hypothetical protein
MNVSINGFYAAYLTGAEGQGFALLVFRNGRLVGADARGVIFDGNYTADQGASHRVKLRVKLPANIHLIQGGTTGPQGETYELTFELPSDFLAQGFIRIEGKHGPVNTKFVRLGDLDA